ncbi:MAG: hypothetical protein QM763_02855 [Agriterribacter sp.]
MLKIILPVLLCILILPGCFEVVEKIDLHDDGSGSFQFIVNMSKSKTRINSMMKMKTINGRPVPTRLDITQKTDEIKNLLAKCKGISNVTSTLDLENYIATVKCSFDKIENLNLAFRRVAEKQKAKASDVQDSYAYQAVTKVFSRMGNFSLKIAYDKLSNADKEIFNDANYTGIMRFDSEVKSASNSDSKIAADKRAVMLRESVLDIITKKKTIENTITLIK